MTILLLLCILCVRTTFAQTLLNAVDTSKVALPKVMMYVQHQMENGTMYFNQLKPSLEPDETPDGYQLVVREFLVKKNVGDVWNTYLHTGLQKAWNTQKINYAFSYSNHDDALFYRDDSSCKLDTGLIVFLNLKLLFGVKNLAMAFEITRIDPMQKILEFSYLKHNETEGKQQLIFEPTDKGYTLITHLSYYKSRVKTRDRLYPLVHAQIIRRFHRNMKAIYKMRHVN